MMVDGGVGDRVGVLLLIKTDVLLLLVLLFLLLLLVLLFLSVID